jgi:hypothetical protein
VGRARHGQELDDQGRLHERGREHAALKLIEVDRDEVAALPPLFDLLRARSERFVVLCDDLSFEDGAAAAKALKSALEGGVAGPPENVLFVATSNRRHLMPRDHVEKQGAIAAAEDAEEEMSVSDRFGLWIGFPPMDQPTYLEAIHAYAARFGLKVENIERRALQWSQLRGARSGRVAWQFIRDLAGELGVKLGNPSGAQMGKPWFPTVSAPACRAVGKASNAAPHDRLSSRRVVGLARATRPGSGAGAKRPASFEAGRPPSFPV